MTLPLISVETASAEDGPLIVAAAAQSATVRETPAHQHARGQLLGSVRGLLSIGAADNRWVVPATHAVWIPPHVQHGLRSHGPFCGWSVYVRPSACCRLPARVRVIGMSDLLQAAVKRALDWQNQSLDAAQTRLAAVILDEIGAAPIESLALPMPGDARLLKVARALTSDPADRRGFEAWAERAGVAPRTLSRRFVAETGFTFTEWRQRARLLRALEMLAAGQPVTMTALDLGYDNVSAFIAVFRRVFGTTPGRYVRGE